MYVDNDRLFRVYQHHGHPINSAEESAHWRLRMALLSTYTVVLEIPSVLLELIDYDTHHWM